MYKNFRFNNVKQEWLYALRGRQKAPFAPIRRNLIRSPGRPGAFLASTDTDVMIIRQPIGFDSIDEEQALEYKDILSTWLYTDGPAPLEFDDEPGRTYYAVINNTADDLERIVDFRRGTIEFLCLDPFAYGPEESQEFTDVTTLQIGGTAPTPPVFNLAVNESITYALIQNQRNQYMMIGQPFDVEEQPFERNELILHDTLASTVGWGSATSVDNGSIRGTMVSDGTGFIADTFGNVVAGDRWQGPSLKRSFPGSASIDNFRVDAKMQFDNIGNKTGMIEIYLLDSSNAVVGKIGIEDRWSGRDEMFAKARAGDASTGEFYLSESNTQWNDFDGGVRISRIDGEWVAYIYQLDSDGNHVSRRFVRVDGLEDISTEEITQVQIAIRKYPDTDEGFMRVSDLKVYRINEPGEAEIPYIAHSGDVITFDHETASLFINGEPADELKDFGADYFDLEAINILQAEPQGAYDVTVNYRERYR